MIAEWLGLELGLLGTVVFYVVLVVAVLFTARFAYERAADDEPVRESVRDSWDWFGALAGAAVGVVALLFVEGADIIAMAVDFVGGHALGFVTVGLTGLAAALAEGVVSLSAGQVAGIAIALVGAAMLSVRWVDEW